jgi:hypothetical protein
LPWSAEGARARRRSRHLVINPVIYSEVSIRYSRIEVLAAAVPKTMFDREAIPYEGPSAIGRRLRPSTRLRATVMQRVIRSPARRKQRRTRPNPHDIT